MYKHASRFRQRLARTGTALARPGLAGIKLPDKDASSSLGRRLDRAAEARFAEEMAAYQAVKGQMFIVRKEDAPKKKRNFRHRPRTAPQGEVIGKGKRRRRRQRNRQAH